MGWTAGGVEGDWASVWDMSNVISPTILGSVDEARKSQRYALLLNERPESTLVPLVVDAIVLDSSLRNHAFLF